MTQALICYSIEDALAHTDEVKILDLSGQAIEHLSLDLLALEQLTTVILDQNTVLADIPEELAYHPTLNTISLRHAASSTVACVSQCPWIEYLDVSGTALGPNTLTQLGNLRNLKSLKLTHADVRELPPALANLTSLRELRVDYNRLVTLPPDLQYLQQLEILGLSYNQFERLPSWLYDFPKLQRLYIQGNQLAGEGEILAAFVNRQQAHGIALWVDISYATAPDSSRLDQAIKDRLSHLHVAVLSSFETRRTSLLINDTEFIIPRSLREFLYGYQWAAYDFEFLEHDDGAAAATISIGDLPENNCEHQLWHQQPYVCFASQGLYTIYCVNFYDEHPDNPTVYAGDREGGDFYEWGTLLDFVSRLRNKRG